MFMDPRTETMPYIDHYEERTNLESLMLAAYIVSTPGCLEMFVCKSCNKEVKDRQGFRKHSHTKLHLKNFKEWIKIVVKNNFEDKINRTKLQITYDFVREFPMLYIEPVTRKEIEECSTLEMHLQGDKCHQAKLEEVQQRKTRAMRRLWQRWGYNIKCPHQILISLFLYLNAENAQSGCQQLQIYPIDTRDQLRRYGILGQESCRTQIDRQQLQNTTAFSLPFILNSIKKIFM